MKDLIKASCKLIFLLILISCNNESNKIENYIVYNQSEYFRLIDSIPESRIEIIDTHCINETKRAELDIANNELTFLCDSLDYAFSEKQLTFDKIGVNVINYAATHIGIHGFDPDCYYKVMMTKLYDKFGEQYIDSLIVTAERNFAIKNPDSAYIRYGQDLREVYLK